MSPGARVPGDPTARPLPIVPVLQAPADIPAVANLGNLLRRRARLTPDRPACYRKILRDADGRAIEPRWETLTWRQFHDRAATVARGLIDLGLAVGARVAILGPTNVEWGVCDFGGHLAGLATAGIYPRQTAAQIRHLLQHSGAEAIFVAGGTAWGDDGAQGREELANVVEAAQDAPDLRAIVVWGAPGDPAFDPSSADDPRLRSLDAFAADPPLDDDALDARLASVGLDDLAILIYTSGTTGPPKGAMLQQRQILSSTHQQILDVQHYQNDRMLCFLPMAHVIERVLLFYARTDAGMPAAYATTMGGVLQELQEVRPTKFSSVPRLFEKAYATIRAGIAAKPAPVRALAAWAEGVGNRRAEAQLAGRAPSLAVRLQWPLAERLVFRKVQQAFGGQITMLLTGAAPIPPDVLRFFWAAGLPLYEGYGLTESTGLSHINRPGTAQLGSVGRPMTGLEHRLAEDGEVLLRGATIFAGYFRNDDATAEVLQDGWLHTGDIGTIDDTGFLRITDRKKHLIITAGGKNVAPANIARAIAAQSPWIGQVHPHGDRRPYISALITPSATVVLDHAMAQGWIDAAEAEAMLATLGRDPASRPEPLQALVARASEDAEVRTAILEAVQAGNRQLSRVERVRRFAILPRDFSREDEALTPTLKLRRKAIETRFSDEIERIYTDPAFGLEAEAAG